MIGDIIVFVDKVCPICGREYRNCYQHIQKKHRRQLEKMLGIVFVPMKYFKYYKLFLENGVMSLHTFTKKANITRDQALYVLQALERNLLIKQKTLYSLKVWEPLC